VARHGSEHSKATGSGRHVTEEKRVVVFSSTEGLPIANEVQKRLAQMGVRSDAWNQGRIPPGELLLRSVQLAVAEASAAVLVMTPDLRATRQGKRVSLPSDNLVFECGLAVGMLSLQRTFVLKPLRRPREPELRLPSDINGAVFLEYALPPNDDFKATVTACCSEIEQHLAKLDGLAKKMDWADVDRAITELHDLAFVRSRQSNGIHADAIVGVNPGGGIVANTLYHKHRVPNLFTVLPHLQSLEQMREALAPLSEIRVADGRPIRILVVNDSIKTGTSLSTVLDMLSEQFGEDGAEIRCASILDLPHRREDKTVTPDHVLETGYTAFPWGDA